MFEAKQTRCGQLHRYGDSAWSYDIVSDLSFDEVEDMCLAEFGRGVKKGATKAVHSNEWGACFAPYYELAQTAAGFVFTVTQPSTH